MLEIPEAFVAAAQLNAAVKGKCIRKVTADYTPHKFAFYYGDPEKYHELLKGETVTKAEAYGGMVEIQAGDKIILVGDGAGLRYHEPGTDTPKKHQLLLEFQDGSSLSASIQMYGGIWCFKKVEFDNEYYIAAKIKPSPLTEKFSRDYFQELISKPDAQKLSLKAFLATEQRIPGLGNGVLQDILWRVKLHPKRKIQTLSEKDKGNLFNSIKETLKLMTEKGGRDTEKDLYGNNGGYKTVMSKNNTGGACPVCGKIIEKEAYLGGSIYYCTGCQRL